MTALNPQTQQLSSAINPEAAQVDNFRSTSAAFSAVSGVLGGFAITLLVLVMSPDFLPGDTEFKELTLAVLMFAAFCYVGSASFLSNVMNPLMDFSDDTRQGGFSFGIMLFHLGNMSLSVIVFLLSYQLSILVAFWTSVVIVTIACIVGLINIFLINILTGIIIVILAVGGVWGAFEYLPP
jgi:hypothetical protein